MAIESVTANAGTGGSDFATDVITGSVNVPYVKLMSGADAAEDLIGGDATNGLDVDVTRVQGSVTVAQSTAANLLAQVSNAGTFAVQVDGAALTALQLIDDAVHADDAAFTLGTSKGVVMMGFAGAQSVDANDAAALACDTDGALHIADGGNSITVDNGGTFAVQAAQTGSWTVDLGATDNAVLDSIQTAVELIDNAISGSEMQVDVVASLPAGTNNIGDVDILSIAAGSNLVGDVGIQGRASGGLSLFRSIDIDETEEDVKTSAGTVYAITAFNSTAAPIFLKFYNAAAASVTVGTTTPVLTFLVPGNADSDGAGFVFNVAQGIAFSTAICVAATTGVADNDTGAPGANACMVHVFYS